MVTLSHHRAKATEFLQRADRAIDIHDPPEAAAALRHAATNIVTALAVHQGCKHNTRRQLEFVLHVNIADETLSRSHLKTFREVHTLSQTLSLRGATRRGNPVAPSPAHPEPVEGRADKSNHPVHPVYPCKTQLRRLRRRVASFINDAGRLIAGDPKPVHHHKRRLRRPDLPATPYFTHVRDIISLPNFLEIRDRFRLHGVAMDTDPDPHGVYARGDVPRRCPCHAHLWDKQRDHNRITLSPPWRHALEKTLSVKLPNPLILTL